MIYTGVNMTEMANGRVAFGMMDGLFNRRETWKPGSHHIIEGNIQLKIGKTSIIQVYTPTEIQWSLTDKE